MTDGRWSITLEGIGKIDPEADDEIQVMMKAFITDLIFKGHTKVQGHIGKAFD